MQNAPFPDEVAWRTIAEDLQFDGPLAPNHPSQSTCEDPDARPLFKEFTDGPIAAASLGQVYKATTWDGVEMAVKVQRPRVMRQVALDWTVWSLCLSALKRAWGSKANLAEIADEVGVGVFKELDYVNEARNMDEFNATSGSGLSGRPSGTRSSPAHPAPRRCSPPSGSTGSRYRSCPRSSGS